MLHEEIQKVDKVIKLVAGKGWSAEFRARRYVLTSPDEEEEIVLSGENAYMAMSEILDMWQSELLDRYFFIKVGLVMYVGQYDGHRSSFMKIKLWAKNATTMVIEAPVWEFSETPGLNQEMYSPSMQYVEQRLEELAGIVKKLNNPY